MPDKAVLVPTAERDPAMGLAIFGPAFRGVRAVMYNSHEERAMIHARHGQRGRSRRGRRRRIGSAGAHATRSGSGRSTSIQRPFAIYIGRIDENKGCSELFDFFLRYAATFPRGLDLVLIGKPIMPIPQHPRIHHLGLSVRTRTSSTRSRQPIC